MVVAVYHRGPLEERRNADAVRTAATFVPLNAGSDRLAIGTVLEAAVIGAPDDLVGQHIKAFVVSSDPGSPNGQAISRHCSNKLPRHMVPKEVEFLEELPKTPNGKVDYSALKVSPIKPN